MGTSAEPVWTAEKFKALIYREAEKCYIKTYKSKGKIRRLSELGSDLMNLIDQEQWELSRNFRQEYLAFYFGDRRGRGIFEVNLHACELRLFIWLPKDIVIDMEDNNPLLPKHARYTYPSRNSQRGRAIYYPKDTEEVADLEPLLRRAYKFGVEGC